MQQTSGLHSVRHLFPFRSALPFNARSLQAGVVQIGDFAQLITAEKSKSF